MYSEDEIDEAVSSNVLTPESAAALKAFSASRRAASGAASGADEESFRLLTGFNDIFVSIALVLTLVAATALVFPAFFLFAPLVTGGVSLGLAEYFTRRRRMALPSIVLLCSFWLSALFFGYFITSFLLRHGPVSPTPSFLGSSYDQTFALSLASLACFLHWMRYRVPLAVALSLGSAVAATRTLLVHLVPGLGLYPLQTMLAGGCILFAVGLWWDMTDPRRVTRRSDVAFWLHFSAAPMIVHPIFLSLGLAAASTHAQGIALPSVGILIYCAMAAVALVVDRRAILVSGLVYVLVATSQLIGSAGSPGATFAATGLVIGGALLAMSVWWKALRAPLVRLLPARTRANLPPVADVTLPGPPEV